MLRNWLPRNRSARRRYHARNGSAVSAKIESLETRLLLSATPADVPGTTIVTGPESPTSDTTPTITWTTADNASRYELLVYDLNSGAEVINETERNDTSFTPVSDLAAGTRYQVFVRGINDDCEGPYSAPYVFDLVSGNLPGTTIVTGPESPTSDTTPTITWTTAENASEYEVLVYDLTKGDEVINETERNDTSFEPVSDLAAGTRYQVFVRGVNDDGAGPYSAPYEFDLVSGNIPGTTIVTGPESPTSDTTPTITWTTAENASEYEVLVYDLTKGDEVINETERNDTSFTPVSDLAAGTRYQVFVRGVNDDGAGPYSAPYVFDLVSGNLPGTTIVTGPESPTSDTTPTITWTTAENASEYEVLVYDLTKGDEVINETERNDTSFEPVSDLAAGTRYQVFVRGVNDDGAGPYSAPYEFDLVDEVPASLPGTTTVTGPPDPTADRTPEITWTKADNAPAYEVVVYDVNTGAEVINETQFVLTSFTPESPLDAGMRYQVFVRGLNANGAGPFSAPYEFDVVDDVPGNVPGVTTVTGPEDPTNDRTPEFTWTRADNAPTYDLLVYNLATGAEVINETRIASTSFTPDSRLRRGTRYQVFVRGVNANAAGPYSAPYEFNILGNVPGTTTVTGPDDPTHDRTPEITWTKADNATAYELKVYDVNTGAEIINETQFISTSFTPESRLEANTRYQVFVRGLNVNGAGPISAPYEFDIVSNTSDTVPGATTVTGPDDPTEDRTPEFTWTRADNATAYELYVYDIETGEEVIRETQFVSTSFIPEERLEAGTRYQVFVRGLNANGAGPLSAPYEFDLNVGIET